MSDSQLVSSSVSKTVAQLRSPESVSQKVSYSVCQLEVIQLVGTCKSVAHSVG